MPRGNREFAVGDNAATGHGSDTNGTDSSTLNAATGGTDSALNFVNPAAVGGSGGGVGGSSGGGAGEPVRKRRGRKPGSTYAKKTENISVEGLSGILFSAHMMLAGITRVEEMALDMPEAEQLAQATANMMRHYPNAVISPKTVDTINFIMCCGALYGTRLIAIRNRRTQARQNRTAENAKPVDASVTREAQQPSPAGGKVPDDYLQEQGFRFN